MPGLLSRILPQEHGFLELFVSQAENLQEAARALAEMLTNYTNVHGQAERIKTLEHKGDEATHALMMKLNQTFITPFDREDIHELSSRIDDVLDFVDAVAARLVIYRVERIRPGVADLSKILAESTTQVAAAVRLIGKHDQILSYCIEINRLENESDRLCRTLIAQLFDEEKDSVQIIKWKEIIEAIEAAVDKCEDVANVLEAITLKSA